MKYTLTIETENGASVGHILDALVTVARSTVTSASDPNDTVPVAPPTVALETKAKRGRPPKVTPETPKPDERTDEEVIAELDRADVTFEDVTTAAYALAKAKGRAAVGEVLGRLGVTKSSLLKPEQYEEALAQLTAALT